MRRIVKKEMEQLDSSDSTQQDSASCTTKTSPPKQWKFYTNMCFMKKDIEEDLEKDKLKGEAEMSEEEKATMVEFYKNTPHLWDASLKDYRDRDQRRASLERLSKEFQDKYTTKQLTDTWHKLTTYYQRESVKQESSMKSGAGKEDVYVSEWPFFSSLEFLKDKTQPEMGISTTFNHVAPTDKKKPSKRKREEEKENSMETAKIKVLKRHFCHGLPKVKK